MIDLPFGGEFRIYIALSVVRRIGSALCLQVPGWNLPCNRMRTHSTHEQIITYYPKFQITDSPIFAILSYFCQFYSFIYEQLSMFVLNIPIFISTFPY